MTENEKWEKDFDEMWERRRIEMKDSIRYLLREVEDKCEARRYWSPCEGCKDGHPSFWKTVIESPQWKLWQEEQSRRMHLLAQEKLPKEVEVYDMPEVEECGHISSGHFQEFMKFISSIDKE